MPDVLGLWHKNVGREQIYYSPHSLCALVIRGGRYRALMLCLTYCFCTPLTLGLLSGPTWRLKPGNFPIYRRKGKFHLLPSSLAHCHVLIDLFWDLGLWVASRRDPLSHSRTLFSKRCYKDKTNKQLSGSAQINGDNSLQVWLQSSRPLLSSCAEAARPRLNVFGLSWPPKAHLSLIRGFYPGVTSAELQEQGRH